MLTQLSLLAALVCGAENDAEQILRKHEDALSRLHSIRATVVSPRSTDGGATWKPMLEITVAKSSRKERIHEVMHGGYYAGQWRVFLTERDLAYSPTNFKIIAGVDPGQPTDLPLSGEKRPSGAIYPPVPVGAHGRNVSWSRALLLIPSNAYSLRELYRVSNRKSFRRGAGPRGEEVEIFSLDVPGGEFTQEVSLSPQHNYAISRLSTRYKGNKEAGVPPHNYIEEVEDYYDYEFGLSIPKKVRVTSEYEPNIRMDKTITIESINVQIPDSELDFEFPPGTRVNDFIGNEFHVWGSGKPEHTFRTGREMTEWIQREDEAIARANRRSRIPRTSIIAFSILTVALVGLIIARSKLGRRLLAKPA